MVFCKNLLILFLLIVLPGFLCAQQIVSNTFQKVDYRIPYRKTDGTIYNPGNQLLREMAKDVLKEPWLVKIHISGELSMLVVKEADQYQLLISLKHAAINGDTVYRHFPVADVLFPSHISMKLKWANRADTSGYTEGTLTGKPLPMGDSVIRVLNIAPFDPSVDTLMVREVELYYDSLALQSFMERLALIHDYYASVSLLDSLQYFTADLHLENAKLLPVNYLKVEEMSSVIERIDARDFPGRLLRNGYDPSGLMEKYSRMYKHSRSLVYNFMDEMHKSGIIPWDGDVDRLSAYFTSRVFSYVRRSFLMDNQQGQIYNDCLDHFYDHGTFPPDENVTAMIIRKMFPDAGQDTLAGYISKKIYASFCNSARQLMDQHQYAEAFSMMKNGGVFISGNPFLKGFGADRVLQSKAAEGILNSYIGIASTCILSHKFSMADTYLAKADQYSVEYAAYIRSDSAYRAVFSELFFLRNTDCDQLLDQKKYAAALDCYQQFESTYSARDLAMVSTHLDEKKSIARAGLGNLSAMLSEDALKRKDSDTALFYYEKATALRQDARKNHSVDVRLDSLAPVMAGIKYEQIVRDGAIALEKRQYTLAVNRFSEAKTLADSNHINRDREFDSLYRQAMKNYLIVQLSVSQKKIWANQFDSAQLALQRTQEVGFDYGLLTDPDMVSAMDKYKVKIREQQCRNLQDSVDLRLIRADRSAALKNYMNVTRYYQEALNLSMSDSSCKFNQIPLKDSLAKYQDPSDFQRNEQKVNALIAVGDYSGAIHLLIENWALFLTGNLSRFGLKQTDLYGFTSGKNNPYLTESIATFFYQNGNYREAFRFLTLLRSQDFEARQVKTLQENLAKELAKADQMAHPDEPTSEGLLRYPAADDWFSVFRDTYSGARGNKK